VVVLKQPPTSRLHRFIWTSAVISALSLVALAAVMMRSRKKLREQISARREAELQFVAVNNERSRLALELHDTLEQGLTGIAMQLEGVMKKFSSAPERARRHLEVAQSLVDQERAEVHRSVWNLRSQLLENNDLASALSAIGRQLSDGTDISIAVEEVTGVQRLPEAVENNLLRIGQEAIANSLKHGRAHQVRIQLHFKPDLVIMSVRDNGQGFVENESSQVMPGHFGLVGMRERAKRLGGELRLQSEPGTGTIVTVEVPLIPTRKT
jgi:signal transduction histidine kinase